ncbi:MAG: DUF3368 domain-containing protein [Nitrosomonadales bacterium]|nr:DUF3368 domain-containing protein [Nitrosomonadales bacterium]
MEWRDRIVSDPGILVGNWRLLNKVVIVDAGVPVIGTVGVVVLAKHKGLAPLANPRLEKFAASGYFLGAEIITAALAASGEQAIGK